MDMSEFKAKEGRLEQHTKAIRDNQVSVALMLLYLNGFEVTLQNVGIPLAEDAKLELDSLGYESVPIWSCSPTAGGIWETWQRDALKYGRLERSWETYCLRTNRPTGAIVT